MIEKAEKEDLCQISLTGLRSLILLNMLIKNPQSLEEIRETFIKYNIMSGSNSDDILRIDINTLKSMGCEISRADHRTNNKYVLLSHPFKINISDNEFNVLKRAFNKIKDNADINVLIRYDELFKKIAHHTANPEIKEGLLGLSPLNKYKTEITEELRNACNFNKVVKLIYKTPDSNKSKEKEIVAEKVILQNNKLYLYGIDKNSKQSIYLNIKRILGIISQSNNDENITSTPVTIKFVLTDFGISGLDDNEKIISGDISKGFTIEGIYHNEFIATQRILSFGSKCTVIEPLDFQEKIVTVLKKMRGIYND